MLTDVYLGFTQFVLTYMSPDSSVDIATGYTLDDRGSIPGSTKVFSSAPQHPD